MWKLLFGTLFVSLSLITIASLDEDFWRTPVPENIAAVLHPVERIAYSGDWRHQTERKVRPGGHAFAILRTGPQSCESITATGANVKLFAMHPTEITAPSSEDGKIGTFYETLIPRNPKNCTLSRYVFAEWQPKESGPVVLALGGTKITVNVKIAGEKIAPTRRLMIATTNNYLIRGHCKQYCKREGELAHKYARALQAHLVQPIQNWVTSPPIRNGVLDLDFRQHKNWSFRQTTMQYAGDGMIGFPRARHYKDKIGYLRALETTILREGLEGRAWVYAVDEPKITEELFDELKLYRLFAPSALVMVTTGYDKRLEPLVDIFAPTINSLVSRKGPAPKAYSGKKLWSYASCMGSCGPNRAWKIDIPKLPGPDTELPDFLIDRSADRLFQYFQILAEIGTDGALYYEATEGYPLVRKGVDLIKDSWNFGGNGDGLLFYPGRPGEFGLTEHQPLPSLRLKLIRHAIESYW